MDQQVADGSITITAEWASLPPDLVQLVADCVLSTSAVDGYMAIRAVCPSWRSAVAKPSPHAAVADPRFRPRQWVILNGADDDQGRPRFRPRQWVHGADDDEGRPLFLNVSTGRFRRLRLPVLRDYIFVGASDGLLVLGDRERPHAARLFNPLTGDMLHFAASIPPEFRVKTAIAGSKPTIIFSFEPRHAEYQDIPAYCSLERPRDAVYSADPTGQLRAVQSHDGAFEEEGLFFVRSMVIYAGNVYVLSYAGTLCKIVWTGSHWHAERIMEIELDYTITQIVESAGKLLLVIEDELETIEVFSIDVKRKVLEPIESLGSNALFVTHDTCMVVDADMLPSIKRNCIYSTIFTQHWVDRIYAWYDLSYGKKNFITIPEEPGELPGIIHEVELPGIIHEGPLSLVQALLTPYPEVKPQLDRIHQT